MDKTSKIKILKQLSRTRGKTAAKALEKEAAKIAIELEKEVQYDLLEEQIKRLDSFAFRIPATAVEMVKRFFDRLDNVKLTHDPEISLSETDLAKYQSKNYLIVAVLLLLDHIRYHELESILEIFVDYSNYDNAEVSKQADQGLKHLAEYNIDIYFRGENRAGFGSGPQLKIIEWLEAQNAEKWRDNYVAIIGLCGHLLSPSMVGTSWDYKSVTISNACTPATDEIKDIRRRSLQLLQQLYGQATNVAERSSALTAMLSATSNPRAGDYGDDVIEMIAGDTLRVLGFFMDILPDQDLQIIQKIEHDVFWRFRWTSSDEVKAAALEIRDFIAENDEYTIYKNLVGFEGIFEDWEESESKEQNFGRIEDDRSERAKEYADSISTENWDEWRERILQFAKTESNDLAAFPKFYEFLKQFAERSPDLAFDLLTEDLDGIQRFTIPLLIGLWKGSRKADLKTLILEWIASDRQLIAITKLFLSVEDIDKDLLGILLVKGTEDRDRDILIHIVAVCASNYAEGREDLVREFFLPAVIALTEMKDTGWIDTLWYRKQRKDILHSLAEEGWEIILKGLIVGGDIDYHAEELLEPLAKEDPARVIEFFAERLRYKLEVKPEGRYDEIPFSFIKLHETLVNFPEIAVDTVRTWFDPNDIWFQYRGAHLLQIIFTELPVPFAEQLFKLVRTEKVKDIEFVLSILQNYEGGTAVQAICREIVATRPDEDKLLSKVSMALRSTGVVMGEFGFAEAYEQKIEEIRPWLDDESEAVRKFAVNYVREIENMAKSDRRRAEEEIELRKHEYGVRDEEADDQDGAGQQQESINENGGEEE